MKRYFLFIGDEYYPAGGMEEFIKDYNTFTDTQIALEQKCRDGQWYEIYDTEKRESTIYGHKSDGKFIKNN